MVELPRAEIRPAGGALDGQTAGGRDDELLHGRILDSMTCGVMLIDAGGVITAFNAAAAELLGLDRRSVVGRVFAEVFLSNETFDDFSEAVLRAVYDGSVGDQQVINVPREARLVPLAVSTSCLRDACGGERTDPGVVAVFSDISELEELRARQIELARDLESKHEELKEAYRSLEGRNRRLDALVRRVKAARTVAAVFVIALGVGIGVFAWRGSPAGWIDKSPAPSGQPMETRSFVTVEPSRIVSTITVATEIDPRREVAVTSPVRGTVAAVHVQHGETVHAGTAAAGHRRDRGAYRAADGDGGLFSRPRPGWRSLRTGRTASTHPGRDVRSPRPGSPSSPERRDSRRPTSWSSRDLCLPPGAMRPSASSARFVSISKPRSRIWTPFSPAHRRATRWPVSSWRTPRRG